MYKNIRCKNCNKKLLEIIQYNRILILEIKCPRCKTIDIFRFNKDNTNNKSKESV